MTEGVSNVTLVADANGNMVPHTAIGVEPTKARTRVLTLLPYASLI